MNNILKEFKLSTWAINNRMTVFVITFMIIFAGIFSYQNMLREAFPEIVVPQIFIITLFSGNPAHQLEKLKNKT